MDDPIQKWLADHMDTLRSLDVVDRAYVVDLMLSLLTPEEIEKAEDQPARWFWKDWWTGEEVSILGQYLSYCYLRDLRTAHPEVYRQISGAIDLEWLKVKNPESLKNLPDLI